MLTNLSATNAYFVKRCTNCRRSIRPRDGVRDGRTADGKAAYRHWAYDARTNTCSNDNTQHLVTRRLAPVAA